MTASSLLDELALAGPEHLDPSYVARYDRKARFNPTEDLDDLRARGLGPTSVVVDAGAGTGIFALAAAPLCRRVIAFDVSPVMVDATRRKAASSRVTNLDCVHAGFVSYNHSGEPADVVYTRNALHHLPDFWKAIALTRLADMLKSGGILLLRDLVFSFQLVDAGDAISHWLAAASATDPGEGWTREELETHLRDEFSTFAWLLEPMLARAGLDVVDAVHHAGVYARYVCVKRDRSPLP